MSTQSTRALRSRGNTRVATPGTSSGGAQSAQAATSMTLVEELEAARRRINKLEDKERTRNELRAV